MSKVCKNYTEKEDTKGLKGSHTVLQELGSQTIWARCDCHLCLPLPLGHKTEKGLGKQGLNLCRSCLEQELLMLYPPVKASSKEHLQGLV